MADINQIITLGIGTPAGIPEFLTFGLQIGAAVTLVTPDCRTFGIPAENRIHIPSVESRVYTPSAETRILEIEC